METNEPAAQAPPPHARRRRPRRWKDVCAPKRRAFRLDDGAPVDAAHALTGSGLYEYGGRAVHRKKLPGAAATEDKAWYFAFDPHRRGDPVLIGLGGDADAITPTHAMLQSIVWEKRFVRCTIDGEPFTADLTDAVREHTGTAARALRGPRRPDVSARAVRASDRGLNGRPLDVEIAVTNTARTYERIEDLLWSKRTCLELCAERDEALEADADALEDHLRAQLLAGAFTARWIVAPDGAKAQLKTVEAVHQLLEHQRALAEDELACARGELESAHALLDACTQPPVEHDTALSPNATDDAAALARVAAERDALLAVVEAHHRDRDATSLVWMLAERIMPSLRERRLRTRALRMAAIRTEPQARFPASRSGLMQRAEAFDRAMHSAMSDAAVRRAEAESLVAIGEVSVGHAEERLERVAEYGRMLDELEAAGARQLLFPPGTSLRATIAYEHRRRFGATPRAEPQANAPALAMR
ncbi:MAG TPA: hypothetical protein VHS78_11295 [Candidatus Elarobacter sp.]|jgi:hypothetical protein|nr:hypothetical protein [Candidatus Elarobacter sp.]